MSRLAVHRSIHDELVDQIVTMVEGLSVGPGIGREKGQDAIHYYIQSKYVGMVRASEPK